MRIGRKDQNMITTEVVLIDLEVSTEQRPSACLASGP